MKITLLLVGKTDNKLYAEGIEDYVNRINHYTSFDIKVISDLKNTKNLTENQQKEKEGELILKNIENKQQTIKQLTFVIGGPYGFSKSVYERANEKISLSKMTFSHQMVRLLFTEQIYRACTIIRNEHYHHE